MVAELVSTQVIPYFYHQNKLLSSASARPTNGIIRRQESALLLSCSWGLLNLTHASRSSSTLLPNQGVMATLPSAAAIKSKAVKRTEPTFLLSPIWASPPMPSSSGPASLFCPEVVQGPLYSVLQPVRRQAVLDIPPS